ncbi:hypothetical protein DPEC_G00242880 [Dallia pectoralis]|uniref:Uncharacterized protein n=1 Tax=Dallia pectoralis TaxID=75939 RepID=A0ACC2FV94_DALPE|nr:hypothetical protein DPEC_G00242880 [Dallia pectoralis]
MDESRPLTTHRGRLRPSSSVTNHDGRMPNASLDLRVPHSLKRNELNPAGLSPWRGAANKLVSRTPYTKMRDILSQFSVATL